MVEAPDLVPSLLTLLVAVLAAGVLWLDFRVTGPGTGDTILAVVGVAGAAGAWLAALLEARRVSRDG